MRNVRSLVELLLARFATSTSSPLDDYVRDEPPRFRHPAWEHGYELAVEVLDELFDGAQDHIDIEWGLARFGVEVVEVGLSDTELRAVSFAGPHHAPTVAVNMSCSHGEPPTARRFTLAHELCHLLFDRDKAADLAIASGPWAPRDLGRRANAFAAMLLMPPWLIRQAESTVGDPVGSPEGAAKVAEVLGVSHSALVWHTFNLGIVDTPPRNLLRPDLADQG
ncbi:MAG: ImmA/IrrE family metallo-endopeptidase [Actinomycetota bacterium]|nr:ImmA/IrrE family metallo-endopeptidase [Actinomycetota bacterium]